MCPMKRFFKLKDFKFLLECLFSLVMFATCVSGWSSILVDRSWSEAETVSAYMSRTNTANVLLTSRSVDYPSFVNTARNYLGYEITRAYANKQESYVCSMPDKNEKPFVLKETNSALPFICLNGYGGNKESYVTRYCSLMFGNEIKSADLGIDDIYITKSLACKILKSNHPTLSDYESLISNQITFQVTKNGISQDKEFTIVDIATEFKYSWMGKMYGDDLVFAGFYCAEYSIIDNLMVHSVIENDVYSNAYFFLKAKALLEQKCSYKCEYSIVKNYKIESNTVLNFALESAMSKTTLFQRISLGLLLIAVSIAFVCLIFYNFFKSNRVELNSEASPLFLSISFASSLLLCSALNRAHLFNTSFFSPFGFIPGFILFVFTIGTWALIKRKNGNITRYRVKI